MSALRIQVYPAESEAADVMPEDVVLEKDLPKVIMADGQVRHLKPECQQIYEQHYIKRSLEGAIDSVPPARKHLLQRSSG